MPEALILDRACLKAQDSLTGTAQYGTSTLDYQREGNYLEVGSVVCSKFLPQDASSVPVASRMAHMQAKRGEVPCSTVQLVRLSYLVLRGHTLILMILITDCSELIIAVLVEVGELMEH